MTDEPLDSLEAELAGLRPQPLPPAVRRRIAERLGAPRWTWRRWAVTLSAAAAAGIAVVLAWPTPEPDSPRVNDRLVGKLPADPVATPATLAEYRRAFGESPATLEQVLNRHTTLSLRSPGNAGALRAGQRFDPAFLETIGEP